MNIKALTITHLVYNRPALGITPAQARGYAAGILACRDGCSRDFALAYTQFLIPIELRPTTEREVFEAEHAQHNADLYHAYHN